MNKIFTPPGHGSNKDVVVGYAYLSGQCGTTLPPSSSVAVREKWRGAGRTSIPAGATTVVPFEALGQGRLIDHVLLALRYEGIDLSILGEALKQVPAGDVLEAFNNAPTGEFARITGFLWEHFNQQTLEGLNIPRRRSVKLFNPQDYYTRLKGVNDPKWSVEFNGLGSLSYCPAVRRDRRLDDANALLWNDYDAFVKKWTPSKVSALSSNRLFQPKTDNSILARTMRHAFLGETESSFRIESEEPSGNKKEQFIQLLRNAHDGQTIDEEFLATLQRFCVDPRWAEFQYRDKQNWLGNGSWNISSRVTYVPPPANLVPEMMVSLCNLINHPHENDLPAMALSGVVSLGFVFIHPFLDGNGRISRYLAHQSLCNSGKLPNGMVLPLSSAMLDEQETYLAALTEFSGPMRTLWDVSASADPDVPNLAFNGSDLSYRHWDGAASAAFVTDMGRIALDEKLVNEAFFLQAHDVSLTKIQELSCHLPDKEISKLIRLAATNIQNPGTLSGNKRKQFTWIGEEKLSRIESIIEESFAQYIEATRSEDVVIERDRSLGDGC